MTVDFAQGKFVDAISIAELRKRDLLLVYLRSIALDDLVSDIDYSPDDYEQAERQWLAGKSEEKSIQLAWSENGLTPDDVKYQIIRNAKSRSYARQNFQPLVATRFLEKKNSLDRVTFSLLFFDERESATAAYLSLSNNEFSFHEYPINAHSFRKDYGPTPFSKIPLAIANGLRQMSDASVSTPFKIENKYVIAKRVEVKEAVLDSRMSEYLCMDMFAEHVSRQALDLLDNLKQSFPNYFT